MDDLTRILTVLRQTLDEATPQTRMRLALHARVIRANGWFNQTQPMLPVSWEIFDVLCGDAPKEA